MDTKISQFLAAKAFGVVGASANREKYGNKVLRCYLQHGRRVVPVNPRERMIEGLAAVGGVKDLPPEVDAISIITPPAVTERVVDEAIAKGIKQVWMQPGAESPGAVERAERAGLNVISDGSCLLVALGYSEK
jgi:predicted CoA-binding protein